jgi:hypothetical protein
MGRIPKFDVAQHPTLLLRLRGARAFCPAAADGVESRPIIANSRKFASGADATPARR